MDQKMTDIDHRAGPSIDAAGIRPKFWLEKGRRIANETHQTKNSAHEWKVRNHIDPNEKSRSVNEIYRHVESHVHLSPDRK